MNAFQVGICTFKWDPTKQSYSARPFNVYCLPQKHNALAQFKASNLEFLMKNKFDFNKLFAEGVTYRRLSEKAQINSEKGNKTWLQQLSLESQKSLNEAKKCISNMTERCRLDPETNVHFVLELESPQVIEMVKRYAKNN